MKPHLEGCKGVSHQQKMLVVLKLCLTLRKPTLVPSVRVDRTGPSTKLGSIVTRSSPLSSAIFQASCSATTCANNLPCHALLSLLFEAMHMSADLQSCLGSCTGIQDDVLVGWMQLTVYAYGLLQRDSRAHLAPVVGLGIDGGCLIPVLLSVELAILWRGRILSMDRCRAPFCGVRSLWPAEHRSWQE